MEENTLTLENVKKYLIYKINNSKRLIIKSIDKNILFYINNLYVDSESVQESIYRLLNNIKIRPICPMCKNKVKFNSLYKGFYKHCSQKCAQSDPQIYKKIIQTKINIYGSSNNHDKIIKTCKEKYGVEYILQIPEKHLQIRKKCKEKYNNETFRNIEKSKQTCLIKYNSEYYFTSDECKEKIKQKFGVDNYRKTNQCKEFISKYIKEHKEEIEQKKKKSYIQHYGVDNPMKSDKIKSKFNWKEIVQKQQVTKQKNNSFNTSKIEVDSYNYLKSIYPDVVYQYKDKQRYPFICDFYIPSLDLFIECNYHWTHGGKPYEGTEEDEIKLSQWKEKAKISQFYKNAIQCWTIRDVEKRKIAKQNRLKYLEIWNFEELKLFYIKTNNENEF